MKISTSSEGKPASSEAGSSPSSRSSKSGGSGDGEKEVAATDTPSAAPKQQDSSGPDSVLVKTVPGNWRQDDWLIFLTVVGSVVLLIILAFLIFFAVRKITIVIDRDRTKRPELKQLYCNSTRCKVFSRDILGFLDWHGDACKDFFAYVCSGFSRESRHTFTDRPTPNSEYSRLNQFFNGRFERGLPISEAPPDQANNTLLALTIQMLKDCHAAKPKDRPSFGGGDPDVLPPGGLPSLDGSFDASEFFNVLGSQYAMFAYLDVRLSQYPRESSSTTLRHAQRNVEALAMERNSLLSGVNENGHIQLHHPAYFEFLNDLREKYKDALVTNAVSMRLLLEMALLHNEKIASGTALFLKRSRVPEAVHSAELRCLEVLSYYKQPIVFDRVRAMFQREDLSSVIRQGNISTTLRAIALAMLKRFNILTDAERVIAENKVKAMKMFFMYPFSNLTKKEAGPYPYTSSSNWPSPTQFQARFIELVKAIRRIQAVQPSEDDLRWLQHDALGLEPFYNTWSNDLFFPAQYFQRAAMTMQFLEEAVLPLDLPLYGFLGLREMFHSFNYLGRTIDADNIYNHWYSQNTLRKFNDIKKCFEDLLKSYKITYTRYEIHNIIADSAAIEPLYQAYLAELSRQRKVHKPRATVTRLDDVPNLETDKLFAITLASGLCENTGGTYRNISNEGGLITPAHRINFLFKNWERFRDIFDCRDKDPMVADRFCKTQHPPS